MGCGCLEKNRIGIYTKYKEINNNFDIPLVVDNHTSNLNINNNNLENGNDNKINHNNVINNSKNDKNLSSIQPNQINMIESQHNSHSQNNVNNNNNINNSSNINHNENYLMNENILNDIPEENMISFSPLYEPYLQSKYDENFNFKELENEFIGEGVKKMKGYISPVSYEELIKIREEFWSSRIEGDKQIWELLHMICNDNSLSKEEIDIFMNTSNIYTYKGCINVTYDSKGYLYEIPNYCINEPLLYEKIEETIKNIPNEKNIEIKIRCYTDEKKLTINNHEKVENLKKAIINCKEFQNKYILDNIRIFYGGKELQNQKKLWFYNIENKSILQMLAKKIENKKENNNNIITSKNQNDINSKYI